MATHEVFNQSVPLCDLDLFSTDRALVEALRSEGNGGGAEFGSRSARGPEFERVSAPGTEFESLSALGRKLGSSDVLDLGRLANTYQPVLRAFDRFGRRIDEIEFHPAWHALMALLVRQGMHSAPWARLAREQEQEFRLAMATGREQESQPALAPGGEPELPHASAPGSEQHPRHGLAPDTQLVRAAKYILFAQVENGTQCPITMTWASVPVLAKQPALVADWLPKLMSREYDPHSRPLSERRCALIGMGMTEKQGGSDVRSNTTRAERVSVSEFGDRWGEPYRLTGHKWFMSAPMCDGFLVLARVQDNDSPAWLAQTDVSPGTPGTRGKSRASDAPASPLSCFLVPRWLPDGTRNRLSLQRLKDKLGNRSNASSEVEFDGTAAFLVGEAGRGIPTILEMGSLTRLDCAVASAGMMRRAVAEGLHHAAHRMAFGRLLADQPLMRNVLADLALESEAAMRWALRLARALDERDRDPGAEALLRIGTPLAKYWICRRGPALAFEAMEVMGGNGYVEEAPLARLYRELPVNSIWEGSGNVMCLDVLRALGRHPACREALVAELSPAIGRDRRYDRFVSRLLRGLDPVGSAAGHAAGLAAGPTGGHTAGPTAGHEAEFADPAQARRLAGDLSRAWQAALMLRFAPPQIGAAFCAARLDDMRASGDQAFGTLPAGIDLEVIVGRAMPSAATS